MQQEGAQQHLWSLCPLNTPHNNEALSRRFSVSLRVCGLILHRQKRTDRTNGEKNHAVVQILLKHRRQIDNICLLPHGRSK